MKSSADGMIRKAVRLAKRGDFSSAANLYQEVLRQFPQNTKARNGFAALNPTKTGQATSCQEVPAFEANQLIHAFNNGLMNDVLERAVPLSRRFPGSPLLLEIMGAANARLERQEDALIFYKKLIDLQPNHTEAHFNAGILLAELGLAADAIGYYKTVLKHAPNHAQAYNNLGNAYQDLEQFDAAIEAYNAALRIRPDYAMAYNNLGNTFKQLRRPTDALAAFNEALHIDPNYSKAHYNLGVTLQALERHADAVNAYETAIRLAPGYADAFNNLGMAQQELGCHVEAVAAYSEALKLDQSLSEAHGQLLFQKAQLCDWSERENDLRDLKSLGIEGGAVSPFSLLALEDDPARHRLRAEKLVALEYGGSATPLPARPKVQSDRICIGYFSADFHDHATMRLMIKMLELHDKSQFRIIAYSYGPSIIDEMRARVVAAVDEFRDVRLLGDQEIVDLARQDAVDIAVDLKGFTSGTRFGIFALRAAPIQVSYLGYPGTTGASCMDYVIADQTVIPTEQQENFSEKIIYLPNSYQVNDNTREISTHSFSRSDFGLPDQAFVFCCFNQSYKIGPEEFDVWMSLLRQIDGSVLWLLETNGAAAENLRKEASRRSVSQDRLIFAARAPLTIHLARHRLADLFLDTFNVNAHTTASDALWSGLPVITRLGKGFSARVAGSLLKAIELPELIAESTIEYKNLAYMLANSPSVLDNIREKLDDKIISSVLFDSNIFTRHMEKAYAKIFDETFDGYF